VFKLGILSDELSNAPHTACEMAALLGLRYLELRSYHERRAPRGMTDQQMAELRQLADDWGLRFSSISPGLWKVKPEPQLLERERQEIFPRSLDLCEALGAQVMVSFTPLAEESERGKFSEELKDDLHAMAEQAAARDIVIAIENEPVCVASSTPLVAQLLEQVDHPNLQLNWDPGNDAFSGQGTGEENWPAAERYLGHVHVKDYTYQPDGSMQIADLGQGDAHWEFCLRKLAEIDYDGYLILETHQFPGLNSSQRAILVLRRLLTQLGLEW
jgi:sugar phosphate isomerase/epimerase